MLKKTSEKDLYSIFYIVALVIIFLVLLFFQNKKDKNLFSVGHYTYGKITNIKAVKGGRTYYYEFNIYGDLVKGSMRGSMKNINDKCFVIFDPNDYNKNSMLLLLPTVPDSLTQLTWSGWKTFPLKIEKEKLRKAVFGISLGKPIKKSWLFFI